MAHGYLDSDDADTPGGGALVVVEPGTVTTKGPWRIHSWPELDLPPGALVALRVPFPASAGAPFLANGWQSWSAPTVRRLGHPEAPLPLPGITRRHLFRLPDTGDSSYDFLATADAVVGFTHGGGLVIADVREAVAYAVRRHVGEAHPPVWTAQGDGADLVDQLLDMCGGRNPGTLPVGWNSWEAWGQRYDAYLLGGALQSVRRLAAEGLCDAAGADDGWQSAIGHWVPDPERFPNRLEALAAAMIDAGVEPGLWSAPCLVAPHAPLASERPEWIARRADGAPVIGATVGHWGGPVWVLDVTRSDVREHLTGVAATHAAAGFTTFKLDFLYAAVDAADAAIDRARAGERSAGVLFGPDTVTGAVLDAIREGAGAAVHLLGCGAPLWPSIGKVDMMRIGPDVTRWYGPRPEPHSDPDMLAGVRNGARSAHLRTVMHRRLWANDPDMVLLSSRTEVTDQHRLGWASMVAGSGQLLTLSDDFNEFTKADYRRWAELVSRSRQVPQVAVTRALAGVLGADDDAVGRRAA